MVSFASERLEEALGFWQDVCWSSEAHIFAHSEMRKLVPGIGIVSPQLYNWRKFERVVFDNSIQTLSLSEWGVTQEMLRDFDRFDLVHSFPFEFFEWSRKSRRTYHLPDSLWLTFAEATYPKIQWQDVILPFDSFIITLDGGLNVTYDSGKSIVFDTILVAKTALRQGLTIRLFREPLVPKEIWRFPEQAKRRLDILLRRGKKDESIAHLMRAYRGWLDAIIHPPADESVVICREGTDKKSKVALEPSDLAATLSPYARERYQSGEEEEIEVDFGPLSTAAKIVVGWCLYLQTLTASQVEWKEEKKRSRPRKGTRGVTGIITQVDHICTVLGEARLDPVSYGLYERKAQNSGFFKRPHWRRRHMARPRGSSPVAPKTVEIPPQLIRKDLIPFFGIIGGTNTGVLEEE